MITTDYENLMTKTIAYKNNLKQKIV